MTEMTVATPSRPRRPHRLTLLLAAAAVLVGLIAGAYLLISDRGRSDGGPLENPERIGFSLRQHPGDTIGYGIPIAYNDGASLVTLKSVRLLGESAGMQVVESHAAGPERSKTGAATSEEWPAPDEFYDLRPVAGTTVPSRLTPQGEKGVQFVFALRFPKLGEYETTGIEVQYTAGGEDYTTRIDTAFRVCVVPEGEDLKGPCRAWRSESAPAGAASVVSSCHRIVTKGGEFATRAAFSRSRRRDSNP